MKLGELIKRLKLQDRDKVCDSGFKNPHSYRGYYDQLAFEPVSPGFIGEMLIAAESALNKRFEGYKGGSYLMTAETDCWLSEYGTCSDIEIDDETLNDLLQIPKRPVIVCLCGSTRFFEAYRAANLSETLAGKIVLSVGCDTKSDADLIAAGEMADNLKQQLDELHLRKIDLADEILVLNVNGYIGESTNNEINYARKHNKPIRYLERLGK